MATTVTVHTKDLAARYSAFFAVVPPDFVGLAAAVMAHLNNRPGLNLNITHVTASGANNGTVVKFVFTPDQVPAVIKQNI